MVSPSPAVCVMLLAIPSQADIQVSVCVLGTVITLVTSDELHSGLLKMNPHSFSFGESFFYTGPLVKLVGVVFAEHMGFQQPGSVPGLGCYGDSHFFTEISPDSEDLRGQPLCHHPAEAGHSCALLGHECLPQQAGRGR